MGMFGSGFGGGQNQSPEMSAWRGQMDTLRSQAPPAIASWQAQKPVNQAMQAWQAQRPQMPPEMQAWRSSIPQGMDRNSPEGAAWLQANPRPGPGMGGQMRDWWHSRPDNGGMGGLLQDWRQQRPAMTPQMQPWFDQMKALRMQRPGGPPPQMAQYSGNGS